MTYHNMNESTAQRKAIPILIKLPVNKKKSAVIIFKTTIQKRKQTITKSNVRFAYARSKLCSLIDYKNRFLYYPHDKI